MERRTNACVFVNYKGAIILSFIVLLSGMSRVDSWTIQAVNTIIDDIEHNDTKEHYLSVVIHKHQLVIHT